ncbi:MAG: HlyD family efflux transporter periplasmic adaptor subunit, partial [Verrucomicrobia bacterium]|nr:HlyD family efflux transporter periplasmic adaptor subunit [Verrucomicrobiota bacterium]
AIVKYAEAEAIAAKSEFDRISRLAVAGSVTLKARDEVEARSAAAGAKVGEAQAGMIAAEAEALAAASRAAEAAAALEYTRITAPFEALVVARHAEPGDFLGSDSSREKLFILEQTDPLRIRIHIPEQAAALANAGDKVEIHINGIRMTATLDRVSRSLDPITKTMTAEVDLKASSLLPGSMGSAIITLLELQSSFVVPLAAVHTASDGVRFVRVQEGESTRNVPVTVAAIDGKNAILSSGPDRGAHLIVPR